MQIRLPGNILVLVLILVSVSVVLVRVSASAPDDPRTAQSTLGQASPCANGRESGLPLPSGFLPAKLPEFQAQLKSFLTSGQVSDSIA